RADDRGALVGPAVLWPDQASRCFGRRRGRPMTRSTSSGTRQNLRVRCAIYTRKSSEEGLEQEFNSLQAQREACEAFINSQRHEGWVCLPQGYDDGGFSGATMDRPALQRLLADIAAGRVDTVVERGSVQSFLRGDDNLALIHCGWRLAAQRDSVMANDVDAHGGFSWLVPRPLPRMTPLTLSLLAKATPFRIILWRCCAPAVHRIAHRK